MPGIRAVSMLAMLLGMTACGGASPMSSPAVVAPNNGIENMALPEPASVPLVKSRAHPRIYVANLLNNTITTYKTNGDRTVPTIRDGISSPRGLAVDSSGKLYVVNTAANTVTAYKPNGMRTTPTIRGLHSPVGVAVDSAGNIYVTNYGDNTLTTYDSAGKRRLNLTISSLNRPYGVSIGEHNRIYITNFQGNMLSTYTMSGMKRKLTIRRVHQPTGVVASHNKIYVASFEDNMILTYVDGKLGHPIISNNIQEPCFIALDSMNNIYVTNYAPPPPNSAGAVTIYSRRGYQSKITITTGLDGPVGIAIAAPGSQ
jgi:streptogramin lyase